MKRMFTLNSKSRSRWMLLLLFLLAGVTDTLAQNVTVRTNNGNTIPAVKESAGTGGTTDTFYKWGGFAVWKHNQLNLTMSTTDKDEYFGITDYSQFSNPANNIFKSTGEALQLARGNYQDCYVAFTLPKGYRFTKYTIVFRRNINRPNGDQVDTNAGGGNGSAAFGEVSVPSNVMSDWDWYSDATHVEGLQYSASAAKSTITRTDNSQGDQEPQMGNALYFKLTNSSRAFITLESIEFEFTAEADYTPFTPAGSALNRTAVDIPFSTSTVDMGVVESRNYNGRDRISYSYENVKDLMANLTLFEAESVEPGENYDGISGNVVKYADNGTITSQGDYFQIGRTGNTEQIYYIESPTYVKQKSGFLSPIGYRIVGAKINYTYGQARAARTETVQEEVLVDTKTYPTFTVSQTLHVWQWHSGGMFSFSYWEDLGEQTYYLTNNGDISTDASQRATWFRDEDGYIRLASNPDKYLKNTNNGLSVVGSTESPAKYNINETNGRISIQQNANMVLALNASTETHSRETHLVAPSRFQMISNANYPAPRTLTGQEKTVNIYQTNTETLNFPAFTPSDYTLIVYDKEGNELARKVVNSTTPDGFLTIDDLNNDAVKIGVIGVGLIQGSLTMQALDPYIDRIDIVCQEAKLENSQYVPTGNGRNLTQSFTSSDFEVSGQAFHFYVPTDFTMPCLFTFEGLYSHYGDNTYYGNSSSTNNARYSFVKSPYWTGNSDLYATSYDPDADYEDKVYTLVKGKTEFKFNNAAEIGTSGGTYEEYPFSLARYGETNFDQLYYTDAEMTSGTNKVAYLFTCDETRYNISPATATQHRFYAFYKMDITAQKKDYSPVFEWEKIYDQTLYRDGNATKEDAQWGLKLKTTEAVEGGEADDYGYLTVSQVVEGINSALNTANAPTAKNQILYIDGSKLLSIVANSKKDGETVTDYPLSKLREGIGDNSVVFLPMGQTTNQKNFAYLTRSETFAGAGDFELVDMKPFYSPYEIGLSSESNVKYTRAITEDKYGRTQNQSIILPFKMTLEGGKHKNLDGTEFTLHTMQNGNSLALHEGNTYAYFPAVDAVTESKANTPYLVNLAESSFSTVDGESFVVTQKGATIAASTVMDNSDYTITGASSSGEVVDGTAKGKYTFTPTGTYAGQKVPYTSGIFYYANDEFVNSLDYKYKSDIMVAPFRAYYTTEATNGAKLMKFGVIFDEGNDMGTTGIDTVGSNPDLMVIPGNGVITFTSTIDQSVRVNSVNGVLVNNAKLQAGETRTINVPAGVYVINGVKIVVK